MRSGKGFFKRGLALVLALCMVITGLFVSSPAEAEAATKKTDEYTYLFAKMNDWSYKSKTLVVKKGDYYLKLKRNENYEYTVYISKKKNSGYKKISKCKTCNVVGNSKQMYFTVNNAKYNSKTNILEGTATLYKYVYKTGKITKITNLSIKLDDYNVYGGWHVSYAYGNNVYLHASGEMVGEVYIYNTKTKKIRLMKSGKLDPYAIDATSGRYMITQDKYRGDTSPTSYSLWKITDNGTKKVKTLGYAGVGGGEPKIVGNYIYYASYKNDTDLSRVTFYKCKIDGTGVKKLGVSKVSKSEYPGVTLIKLTNKYVVYSVHEKSGKWKYYKYTFATKKTSTVKDVSKYY